MVRGLVILHRTSILHPSPGDHCVSSDVRHCRDCDQRSGYNQQDKTRGRNIKLFGAERGLTWITTNQVSRSWQSGHPGGILDFSWFLRDNSIKNVKSSAISTANRCGFNWWKTFFDSKSVHLYVKLQLIIMPCVSILLAWQFTTAAVRVWGESLAI